MQMACACWLWRSGSCRACVQRLPWLALEAIAAAAALLLLQRRVLQQMAQPSRRQSRPQWQTPAWAQERYRPQLLEGASSLHPLAAAPLAAQLAPAARQITRQT
jgi:hypothetical protein